MKAGSHMVPKVGCGVMAGVRIRSNEYDFIFFHCATVGKVFCVLFIYFLWCVLNEGWWASESIVLYGLTFGWGRGRVDCSPAYKRGVKVMVWEPLGSIPALPVLSSLHVFLLVCPNTAPSWTSPKYTNTNGVHWIDPRVEGESERWWRSELFMAFSTLTQLLLGLAPAPPMTLKGLKR